MKKAVDLIQCILERVSKFQRRKIMMRDLNEMNNATHLADKTNYDGEADFINKWAKLDPKVSPLSYRIYSNYIGANTNIWPEDTGRCYIEPILNPENTTSFYNDKNSFGLIIDSADMPKTLFRSINKKLYDGEYNAVLVDNFKECLKYHNRVIVKPAKDLGGRGITFFERSGDDFINQDGTILSFEYLSDVYVTDYLIQECFKQSEYIGQFNPTSVNTIRVNTYRDVKTGEIHFLGAALRIGGKGALIDNATSGGSIIGINDDGKLGSLTYNKYGEASAIYNGIDFSSNNFYIPNFEGIKKFAKKITTRFPHMSLFAMDIVLDINNEPKLIEVNTQAFSPKFMQLTKGPVFNEFTDDIIDYCIENKDKIRVGLHKKIKWE